MDLSQFESMVNLLGDEVVAVQVTGERPRRIGNRHAVHAPHGIYRCQGDDSWLFIGISNDAEWQAVCAVIPELTGDAGFGEASYRKAHEDALDALISAWTMGRSADAAMLELQKHGVPAGAVRDAQGLATDAHLLERGFLVELEHPVVGRHRYAGEPIRFSRLPVVMATDAPLLGQHNHEVLAGLLGYSTARLAELESSGAVSDGPAAR